jgi:hypothetical protein
MQNQPRIFTDLTDNPLYSDLFLIREDPRKSVALLQSCLQHPDPELGHVRV